MLEKKNSNRTEECFSGIVSKLKAADKESESLEIGR